MACIVLTINGVSKTIEQWANEKGIHHKTLYGRWSRTKGRPKTINGKDAEHLFRPKECSCGHANERFVLIMPDGKEMNTAEVLRQSWCEVKRTSVERRFRSAKNGILHREDFKMKERNQRKWIAEKREKGVGPSNEWKLLSDKKNTGRGKGEIPQEVWVTMPTKASLDRTLCATFAQ